ncbi:MAG: MarR family transcriptional regulator [Alphaproteobacteria bacterium]|nr:MarR family transcriptional regulator [Alphaproteobacteria bacterium]
MPKTSTRRAARGAAYRLDDQVGFLLRRAYQRASANLTDRIRVHDLTPPQFATLARLYERGNLSQNRLGRLVAMEPANIRDVVQRLRKRRLVATGRDATDSRRILVGLTAAGAALVTRLVPVEIACTAKTLAPLAPAERTQLYTLLRRLAAG